MKFFLLLITTLFSFGSFSQTQTIPWQKSYGGSLFEDGIDVLSLPNGDFVVCGSSYSDISGDKTTNSYGLYDYWVFQITPIGSIVWQTTIGGSKEEYPSEIIQTSDGGFMVIGTTASPISGNKTSVNYGLSDAWVVKLSSTGQLEWDKSFGGSGYEAGVSAVLLPTGNYFLACSSSSGISGNKTIASMGGDDYWCVIIDNNGSIQEQFSYGGSGNDRLRNVILLNSSRVVLTGHSNSNISGNKNENSFGNFDFWVLVSDFNGNIISSTTQGGGLYDISVNAVVDPNSNIRVFGNSDSDPSGTKTSANFGYNDYWSIALDSNLNKIGDVSFGGNGADASLSGRMGVYYSPLNEFVIAGESNSAISGNKLEPPYGTMGHGDFWIVGMDINGNKTFEFVAGGIDGDQPRSIIETEDNKLCVIGTSSSGNTGNKTEPSKGTSDIWLFELDFNLSIKSIKNEPELTTYPNPSQTILTFALPMAVMNSKVTLTDFSGKTVFENEISGLNSSQINVSSFAPGIYLLSITSSEFQYTRKIVIQ